MTIIIGKVFLASCGTWCGVSLIVVCTAEQDEAEEEEKRVHFPNSHCHHDHDHHQSHHHLSCCYVPTRFLGFLTHHLTKENAIVQSPAPEKK